MSANSVFRRALRAVFGFDRGPAPRPEPAVVAGYSAPRRALAGVLGVQLRPAPTPLPHSDEPPATVDARTVGVTETTRIEEWLGEEVLLIDNRASSAPVTRSLKATREWTRILTLDESRSQTLGGDVEAHFLWLSAKGSIEAALQRTLSSAISSTHLFEEEISVTVPERTAVRIALGWKRIWQCGDARVLLPDRSMHTVPYRVVVSVTFDQKIQEITSLPDQADGPIDRAAESESTSEVPLATGPAPSTAVALPLAIDYRELPSPEHGSRQAVSLGVAGAGLEPVRLDFNTDPHFLVSGGQESGKTSVLRTLIQGITEAYTPAQARILLVDYRRALLGAVPESHLLAYCASAPAVRAVVAELLPFLEKRRPGPDVTEEQLRTRSWWTGPEVFVIVDDYDLVAIGTDNPLAPLGDFQPMARDLGIHLIISLTSRTVEEGAMLESLVKLPVSRLVLIGDSKQLPPGRGTLVSHQHGPTLIQTAYVSP